MTCLLPSEVAAAVKDESLRILCLPGRAGLDNGTENILVLSKVISRSGSMKGINPQRIRDLKLRLNDTEAEGVGLGEPGLLWSRSKSKRNDSDQYRNNIHPALVS